jgi:hypothetical protein
LRDIAQLDKETDIVIVSIHWGPNMKAEPEMTIPMKVDTSFRSKVYSSFDDDFLG